MDVDGLHTLICIFLSDRETNGKSLCFQIETASMQVDEWANNGIDFWFPVYVLL